MKPIAQHDVYSAPASVLGETNDCGVRALMTAACISYDKAHTLCKNAGRKNGEGMCYDQMAYAIRRAGLNCMMLRNTPRIVEYTTRRIGNYIFSVDQYMRRKYYPSITEFCADHPRGHFIVGVSGHYIAICDGIVHDWRQMGGRIGARARRGVRVFWKLV